MATRLGSAFEGKSRTNDSERMISIGDFRINLQSREVWVRGKQLGLEREEFDMLVFLTGHRSRLVTSRTLLSTRWKEHEVRRADFLRVLASLRTKIEAAAGARHYIRTEPWVFYRFDPSAGTRTRLYEDGTRGNSGRVRQPREHSVPAAISGCSVPRSAASHDLSRAASYRGRRLPHRISQLFTTDFP